MRFAVGHPLAESSNILQYLKWAEARNESHSGNLGKKDICLTIHYFRRRSGLRMMKGSGFAISNRDPAGDRPSSPLTFQIGSLEVRALSTGVLQRLGAFPVVQNRVGGGASVIVGSYDRRKLGSERRTQRANQHNGSHPWTSTHLARRRRTVDQRRLGWEDGRFVRKREVPEEEHPLGHSPAHCYRDAGASCKC